MKRETNNREKNARVKNVAITVREFQEKLMEGIYC
jgi:hypothetical protein